MTTSYWILSYTCLNSIALSSRALRLRSSGLSCSAPSGVADLPSWWFSVACSGPSSSEGPSARAGGAQVPVLNLPHSDPLRRDSFIVSLPVRLRLPRHPWKASKLWSVSQFDAQERVVYHESTAEERPTDHTYGNVPTMSPNVPYDDDSSIEFWQVLHH